MPRSGWRCSCAGCRRPAPAGSDCPAAAPLVSGGLIDVLDADRPALSRALRVPDRVVAHLLGDGELDPSLTGICRVHTGSIDPVAARWGAGVTAGARLLYLRAGEGDAHRWALPVLAAAGRSGLVVAAAWFGEHRPTAALVREARLLGTGIVLGPVEALGDGKGVVLRDLLARTPNVPVVLFGHHHWDQRWGDRTPVSLTVPAHGADRQAADWAAALTDAAGTAAPDLTRGLDQYRLGGRADPAGGGGGRAAGAVGRAPAGRGRSAGRRAGAERDRAGTTGPPRSSPRSAGTTWCCRRPRARPAARPGARARHRDQVLGEWRMRPGGGRGRGVMALFAGESGTGKTMACRGDRRRARPRPVRGRPVHCGRQVRRRDREEPGARSSPRPSDVNGVLLFDEADAIFGKRSQVTTRTTGTPTWSRRTCSSAWSPSTASPCSPPICGPTWTRRSPAGWT